ncbi:MAG: Gfo/Idh/MocA family oxidoreductase [Gemmatimonadetes bacterium]|jgi:predicted dehydrogenase|nr:Gfo/Idh/MocA family oxidoreductase [Gemmatimonadota bacterium]MBT7863624.1 Gfo/Idh/MocA family oxidoreductase [Gemmatimonadota bacterium]
MARKKPLKMAVIGLGMGRGHAKGYQTHAGAELVALCDQDPERLATTAAEMGVEHTYTDADEMFDAQELDGVSIAVPNKFHAPLTINALKRGLHVLCEKPMAMTVKEAVAMNAAATKARRNLMINFSFRFTEASYALKKQVDAGVVGDIYFGRTVWHRRRGIPKFGGWFGNKELAGGGPLIDLGVHRLDLALWLMGYPEPEVVTGSAYNVIAAERARKEGKTYTVEDLACGMVKFTNGATLILEASWALNQQAKEHMETSLYGDRGGLVHRNVKGGYDFEAEIYTDEGGDQFTKRLDFRTDPTPASYHEFVDSILERRAPLATGDQGLKVMKILEGIYKSAETGREVRYRRVK